MLRRRHLLAAGLAPLAAPAIVARANAQSAFDWKQAKGAKIEVNLQKGPAADVMQARQKEFEELTGIRVGSEQIPEQQQRPKVAMEMSTGRPSFDVVAVALHVQKRLIEKGRWMADLRPLIADASITNPDFDFADFGGPGLKAGTAADGTLHTIPNNQDLWLTYWNKALFAEKGLTFPKTMDEMLETSRKLTDRSKGVYGFVGRGLKNANLPLFNSFLLGQNQESVSSDGRTLLMDTPAAIWAGEMYAKMLRETAPPGVVGFNWNESQTSFSQGKIGMWVDGIGFSAPLINPTKSRVAKDVGFAPVPAGPLAQHSATFVSGLSIPAATRNRTAAWLYIQWATGKAMSTETLRAGSGTPARASTFRDDALRRSSEFPPDWFDALLACQKIARPGLPEIVAVTEFRDTFGVALTNTIGGADVAGELRKATEAFKPVLAKELA